MTAKTPDIPSYSQIACVGAGLSAVALGATLKRWYNLEDIHFFERHPTSGGTWYINTYPGSFTHYCRFFFIILTARMQDAAAMSLAHCTAFPLL